MISPLQSVVNNCKIRYATIKPDSFNNSRDAHIKDEEKLLPKFLHRNRNTIKKHINKTLFGVLFLLLLSNLAIASPVGWDYTIFTSFQHSSMDINLWESSTVPIDTSTVVVINETSCTMTVFCYELDETGDLLNMGLLKAGQSMTIQPRAELGRLYTEDVLTNEETASLYFFGGTFELKIKGACGKIIDESDPIIVDTSRIDTITYDCPIWRANIGDACYDGYPITKDDVITDNCTCKGTSISSSISPCDSFKITTTNEYIIINGLNTARVNSIQVFTMKWKPVFTCAGNCKAIEYISLPNASYRVRVASYTDAWASVCDAFEIITVQKSLVDEEEVTYRQRVVSATTISSTVMPFSTPTLSAYPNPASEEIKVTIQNYKDRNGRIELVNLNGQVIRSINLDVLENTTWQLKVGDLEKGLYVLQYIDNQSLIIEKILIK